MDSTVNIFFLWGGKYGNKLLFASVAVNTTMVLSKTGQTEGLKVYEHWEEFVKQKVSFFDTDFYEVLGNNT